MAKIKVTIDEEVLAGVVAGARGHATALRSFGENSAAAKIDRDVAVIMDSSNWEALDV